MMVLNAAVQMLREADDLKQKILKFKSGTSMLQERNLWVTQQQLQKIYQKVLVLDLDYALDKKVEQDLWNIGFKQQIEALQAISKDRKNPMRSEGQGMLSWVLQAASGFYLCLLHQICTTFKLDLPFRRRASLLGWVEGWGAGEGVGVAATVSAPGARLPPPAAARYICQHCLVHLGDLARYRQQLRIAHTFYRHALVVSAHSGQPYNQLALVAWRRGRRLSALYWHVRSLLVRAPFPPAPANLARTLRAAALSNTLEMPVIPGVTKVAGSTTNATSGQTSIRLDAHMYVSELIRALHMIHTLEDLDAAATLVNYLNSSLTTLIATDSFESMTLVKMACVIIWIVHSSTEDLTIDSRSLTEAEVTGAQLGETLVASALLALLLPAYTVDDPLQRTLPALKVWLQWLTSHPALLEKAAFRVRPQLWPALAHLLNKLGQPHLQESVYDSVPLPEDEELHGFLPLEDSFKDLKFANHVTWDSYGGQIPEMDVNQNENPIESSQARCFSNEPQLERNVRVHRLLELGKQLAGIQSDQFSVSEEDGKLVFTAASVGGEQLSKALADLEAARGLAGEEKEAITEGEEESEEEPPPPPAPIVISEADFREKVREKRVGILKPQGSLERAREERAQATQEDQDAEGGEDSSKGEEKKEARKPRVNIAMAAIMRKQEESNKQVKFVTPPLTPDSTSDLNESKDQEKPKVIQPKAIKSLANLPLGRKTGGILSLKDKSAGYPHLVNTDPEPAKKNEKEEKKDSKPNQTHQNPQQKHLEHPPPQNWGTNTTPQNNYTEPKMTFQKNYGIQHTGLSYNPSYQAQFNTTNQSIKLPVVNPKEIDVRTAALQKQNSRQELFQDGNKLATHNYQVSGDKKNFLNDLPPRFANQYRYWQAAQDNRFSDNKFRDDKSNMFNPPQPSNWLNNPQAPEYQQQPMWWKPENPPPNFQTQMTLPNFYPHLNSNLSNPYQNVPSYNPLQAQIPQNKSENVINPNYMQSLGQPQLQTLQKMVNPSNFNSPLNSFNSYTPNVGYDSSMYPQFGHKLGYQPPPPLKMTDNPSYQGNKELMDSSGLVFGTSNMLEAHRNMSMQFGDPLNPDIVTMKNMEQVAGHSGVGAGPGSEVAASTYSLFSGADTKPWSASHYPTHQSLWSGPGPSPLERLLEQQKQLKQPSTPQ